MVFLTKGNSAPEAIDTNERLGALAEKTGNLTQLRVGVVVRAATALGSGDFSGAGALADQALELALREGSPTSLASAHLLQIGTCYIRGDLSRASRSISQPGSSFSTTPASDRFPDSPCQLCFRQPQRVDSGRAKVARERNAQMMAGVNVSNPHNVAFSGALGGELRLP